LGTPIFGNIHIGIGDTNFCPWVPGDLRTSYHLPGHTCGGKEGCCDLVVCCFGVWKSWMVFSQKGRGRE